MTHEVTNKITKTRKPKTQKTYKVIKTVAISITARSEEDALDIIDRSDIDVNIAPPQDTKNGVFLIKSMEFVPVEEFIEMAVEDRIMSMIEEQTREEEKGNNVKSKKSRSR